MDNIAIIKTPKEGIMGLNDKGDPIVLHNNDMVSLDLLDEKFKEVLMMRGMLRIYKARDPKDIKPEDSSMNKIRRKMKRVKKGKDKKAYFSLERWVGGS